MLMTPAPVAAPVAAIDLGSNTVRLLVATAAGDRINRHLQRQAVTRLGQGLQPGGSLKSEAVRRTWRVLLEYWSLARGAGAVRTLLGATMAVREAADGREFMDRAGRELGFTPVILTGRQEADLTVAGVLTALRPVPETAVVFDLGGRSTEFILTRRREAVWTRSLALGAVALTEALLAGDPPRSEEITAVRDRVKETVTAGLADLPRPAGRMELVGTAGTVTTLAAMDQGLAEYRREWVDNYRLNRAGLERLFARMAGLPLAERTTLPGLPADRADVIVAGTAAVLGIMDSFQANHIIVSDAGLLEGLWLAAAGIRSV
ncbi:MAG: Ppx/GppA family phosphatase [Thermodesulfobacteriota bacterium]